MKKGRRFLKKWQMFEIGEGLTQLCTCEYVYILPTYVHEWIMCVYMYEHACTRVGGVRVVECSRLKEEGASEPSGGAGRSSVAAQQDHGKDQAWASSWAEFMGKDAILLTSSPVPASAPVWQMEHFRDEKSSFQYPRGPWGAAKELDPHSRVENTVT